MKRFTIKNDDINVDPEEVISKIRAWNPLFDVARENYIMLPDEFIFDVKELARVYNVRIRILKIRKKSRFFFLAWIPRHIKTREDVGEEIYVNTEVDYNKIKDMIYEYVKQKRECKVEELKKFFVKQGINVTETELRVLLSQLQYEKKLWFSGMNGTASLRR